MEYVIQINWNEYAKGTMCNSWSESEREINGSIFEIALNSLRKLCATMHVFICVCVRVHFIHNKIPIAWWAYPKQKVSIFSHPFYLVISYIFFSSHCWCCHPRPNDSSITKRMKEKKRNRIYNRKKRVWESSSTTIYIYKRNEFIHVKTKWI